MVDLELGFFERLIFSSGRNKVRILLDLDGAVVPEGVLEDGSFELFETNGYAKWRVRNEVIDWLRERREDSRVELVWSSTWQSYANTIFEELGLEPIEHISFDETYQMPGDWYKKEGLRYFLEEHPDPIVIVDDELPEAFLEIDNPRILCLKPNSLTGISKLELDRIDEFIEAYRRRKIR